MLAVSKVTRIRLLSPSVASIEQPQDDGARGDGSAGNYDHQSRIVDIA